MFAVLQGHFGITVMLAVDHSHIGGVYFTGSKELLVTAVCLGDLPQGSFFPGFFQAAGGKGSRFASIRGPDSADKAGRDGRGA